MSMTKNAQPLLKNLVGTRSSRHLMITTVLLSQMGATGKMYVLSARCWKAIVKAMTGIEKANPDTLSGVFSSFDDATWTDKNKLTDERLKNLIEHMSMKKVGNKTILPTSWVTAMNT